MPSKSGAKGARGERVVAELLTALLHRPVRRALGAGRQDDVGDLDGLPDTVIQVADWTNYARAISTKLPDVEVQMANKDAAYGCLFVKRARGKWAVVQTPEQWAALWLAAHQPSLTPDTDT